MNDQQACIAELHISVETRCRPDLDDIDAANILAVIEQLQAKNAELEAEVERLKAEETHLDGVVANWKETANKLNDQLAKAEQRVAEACAELADKMNPFPEPSAIGPEIRAGEWRKFVKEV